MEKIIVVGDLHFPFTDLDKLSDVLVAISDEQPDLVVQIGDLYDFYCYSRFAKSANKCEPLEETTKARGMAEFFWASVQALAPKADCLQLVGNHDIRVVKQVMDKLPEWEGILTDHLTEMMSFDGVTTEISATQEVIVDGIVFMHGFRTKLGDHARYNRLPTVVGHSHTGGVVFEKLMGDGVIWELNCGQTVDYNAHALQYGNQKHKKWVAGYGLIEKKNGIWCPSFIPLDGKRSK